MLIQTKRGTKSDEYVHPVGKQIPKLMPEQKNISFINKYIKGWK